MRTTLDALRSMKRYAAVVLGDDWEVRFDREQGLITLPFCRVSKVGPTLYSGPSHTTDVIQPMALHLTLEPQDTSEEAFIAALDAEELIQQGFRIGVEGGRPFRVPFYDYDAVALNSGSNKRHPSDYLRVLDLSVTQLPDADDDRRVAVAVDLRMSWRRQGEMPAGDNLVDSVTAVPNLTP